MTIRELANGGTTQTQLREAVFQAPPESNLVCVRLHEGSLRFPLVCPNCLQPATSTLRIERAFLLYVYGSGDDSPNETVPSINAFDVPFCDACLSQRRSQHRAPSLWTPVKRIFYEANGFAGLVVIGIACMFVPSAVERLSLVPLAIGALPFSVGIWLLRSTWKKSKFMSLPAPTAVDMAVDFTPYIAMPFEPAWLAFQFRSPQYADLFREANIDQLWSQRSLEAQYAAAKRKEESSKTNLIVGAVVLAILIWVLWSEFFSP